MLFITTNRVGTFDDAFVSRIDVKLYYPNWQFEDRQKIWKSFMAKLKAERQQHIRVTMGAKEYILGPAMEKLDLNGREIRNAFQTAVALAEFEQNKDEEGTILLEEHHVQQVADMSRDFRLYLDELHRMYPTAFVQISYVSPTDITTDGDEQKRAARNFERHDKWSEPGTLRDSSDTSAGVVRPR